MITVYVPRINGKEQRIIERMKEEFKDNPITVVEVEGLRANEYQKLAARTINGGLTKEGMLHHASLGLASEAGEFAGLLQKIYQLHKYDREHALKELGDCCWMIAEACTALNATLEEVMQTNIDKLKARYPEGFDPEKSLHRKEGDV